MSVAMLKGREIGRSQGRQGEASNALVSNADFAEGLKL